MIARHTRRPVSACALSVAIVLAIAPVVHASRVIFDAAHAEMAGNADWVIDSDAEVGGDSNPARIPTPAQSGITATTPETYWKGGISAWGVTMVKHGNTVESLPRTGTITYGKTSNAQDLSHYKTFVVCEPNTLFTAVEKTALVNFVKDGGGLFIVSDHDISDRNNDGVDSVDAWNDLFTNNGVQSNPFGLAAATGSPTSASNFSQVSTNISASAPFKTGTAGTATNLEFNNGTTFTLSTAANSSVKAAVWTNGSQTNSNVMMAYATYGLGRVVALGDSSPADDGTGDTGDNLFTGWSTGTNGVLIANATDWLGASPQSRWSNTSSTGNWSDASAWTGGIPGTGFTPTNRTPPTIADFGPSLQPLTVITNDKATGAIILRFNADAAYEIAGTGTIGLGNSPENLTLPLIQVTGRSQIISAPVAMVLVGGGIEVAPGLTLTLTNLLPEASRIFKAGGGRLAISRTDVAPSGSIAYGGIQTTINAGVIAIGTAATNATASELDTLSIAPTANLELVGPAGIVFGAVGLSTSFATLQGYIWSGQIETNVADRVVGYATAAELGMTTLNGHSVAPGAFVVRPTVAGDANLDLAVNFADLVALAQHYNTADSHWSDGDFNYSGNIDFADLVMLAQHFNVNLNAVAIDGATPTFAADWALARSLVPEPASLAAAIGVITVASRRRR